MTTTPMNESIKHQMVERDAERLAKKYRPYMDILESKSLLSKVKTISSYDVHALGKQLEAFEDYKSMTEEDGTLAQLGKIPDVALDVISIAYGTSPIAVMASIQPIQEERGIIYFKNIIAQSTRGNVTAGDRLFGGTQMEQTAAVGYAGDTLTYAAGLTADTVKTYNITIPYAPVRNGSVKVTVQGLTLPCIDDGLGSILGRGIDGTINYLTGAVVINLTANPGAGAAITVQYATDFEAATDIPKIIFKLDSKSVNARVFALKDTVGLEQSYALRRRFGMVADDEMANDLVAAINSETTNTLIVMLSAAAMGNTPWSKTPPDGVSYLEHKQSLKDTLASAEAVILGNAGRGTINVMVAGRTACSIIQTLPGFVKISDGSSIGPHIFGTLDGTTIVRVPNSNVLNANEIICSYNGTSPFESSAVYSPYMPLVVTSAMPSGQNPLMQQRAAAVWAAIDVLVPNFVTKITIS